MVLIWTFNGTIETLNVGALYAFTMLVVLVAALATALGVSFSIGAWR